MQQIIRVQRFTHLYVFLRDDTIKRSLEQPYTDLHRVMERISERVFVVKVDGERLNIPVNRLKAEYFTAQQEEYLVNKSINHRRNPL